MSTRRPPLVLRLLIGASLACAAAPAAFAVWSVRDWALNQAGRPMEERRADFRQVPWLRPPFPDLLRFVQSRVPAGEAVLVEPVIDPAAERPDGLSPPRWHVFLTHFGHPLRFYVRAPALACVGFNHAAWLDQHFEVLDLDGSDGGPRDELVEDELAERAIRWRLRIPVRGAGPEFFGLDRRERGAWVEVPRPDGAEWRR